MVNEETGRGGGEKSLKGEVDDEGERAGAGKTRPGSDKGRGGRAGRLSLGGRKNGGNGTAAK